MLRCLLAIFAVVFCFLFFGCGGKDNDSKGPNQVSGTVNGVAFTKIESAFWIGKPSGSYRPLIIFLSETILTCDEISVYNWDKLLGDSQLLEMGVIEENTRSFSIPSEGYIAYLRGEYNPDADSGEVIISAINPTTNVTGSFAAIYTSEKIAGSFDAVYCATGVEP